jgi:hypothetical protein
MSISLGLFFKIDFIESYYQYFQIKLTMSYFGKIIRHVYGEDKLVQKDNEITRLMQLLSQRDAKIVQIESEISQKNDELEQKKIELIKKDELLCQRDAEIVQKETILNNITQKLIQTENELVIVSIKSRNKLEQSEVELSQTKQQIFELQQSIRDLTVIEPIDVQKKLNEMFESWTSVKNCSNYPSRSQLDEVSEKIRVATEQIKEPIIDFFHVTYTRDDSSPWNAKSDVTAIAFIITLSNIYRLHWSSRGSQDYPSLEISKSMDIYNYSYKWIKIETIELDRSINLKTLRKYIAITSGCTGAIYSNSNGNEIPRGCADKVAEQLIKNMIDIIKE